MNVRNNDGLEKIQISAIDELINDDADIILGEGDYFLYALLKDGFKGYANFTDEELIKECEERDISYLFGETE